MDYALCLVHGHCQDESLLFALDTGRQPNPGENKYCRYFFGAERIEVGDILRLTFPPRLDPPAKQGVLDLHRIVCISSLLPTLLICPVVELCVKLYRVVYFLSDFSIFVAGGRQGSLLQVFVRQTITLVNFGRRLAGLLTIICWDYCLGWSFFGNQSLTKV